MTTLPRRQIYTIALTLLVSVMFFSCKTPVENIYFADATDLSLTQMYEQEFITIKPGDKLTILVSTKDESLNELFNPTYITQRLGNATDKRIYYYPASRYTCLYTVDATGDVTMPVLGPVHVEGLTRDQIAALIQEKLRSDGLAQDAQVTVDFEQLTVTLLGEVRHPGRYSLGRDGLTIIDALGEAGDLTNYGNRNNVKVVRTEGEKKRTYVIDLNSINSTVGSPGYYLQQNDVIYVEPNDTRKRQSVAGANDVLTTGFWLSLSSLLTSIASLIINW